MPINRPYRRNARVYTNCQFVDDSYVLHEKYANSPTQYIRAFLLIQKDLLSLFDFIEPADGNLSTYSYRVHELLLRTCVEVEANCVAILTENGYKKPTDLNMGDYKKINTTHRLSSYEVKFPVWNGKRNIRKPFSEWEKGSALPWYRAYNETKHDRHSKFNQATFESLTDAVSGLAAIISSQFLTYNFSPQGAPLIADEEDDGMESAIGGYFRVKFPHDWKDSEKYDFNWAQIKNDPDPFQDYNY